MKADAHTLAADVRPVRSSRERREFVRFPWRIYPGRWPAWVPPLIREERRRIDPEANPFFEHGDVELFLAHRDGRPVGRIAAIENRLHNRFHNDRLGFFGLFECLDDTAAAGVLLDAAADWLIGRGLDRVRGPVSFSTNDEAGLLVENFDDPPCVLMPYNPPYYAELLEGWGLERAKDLLAYEGVYESFRQDRFRRLESLIRRSGGSLRVRGLDMRNFEREVSLVRDLYNAAWERNWGFVPMTDAEVEHMARQLKPVIEPELALVGEVDGEPAGFALTLPDVNQAIRHLNGRLLPFGFLKLLWHLRRVNRVRILTLGLLPEHRRSGLDALLYYEIFERGTRLGYPRGESSWVLEDNRIMCRAMEKLGFEPYKTYRLYERPIGEPLIAGGGDASGDS